MNIKKVMLGMACVLAAMVVAQTAHAQFLTPAEREMWGNAARAFFGKPKATQKANTQPQEQPKAKPKAAPKKKEQQPVQPQQTQPAPNASQTQQPRKASASVGYNPAIYSGREGKAMLCGEMMFERLLRRKVEQAGLEAAQQQQSK